MRLQAGTGIVSFQVGSASGIGSSNAYNVAHACDADARSPFGRALGRVGFLEWGVHSIHVIHFRTLDSIGYFHASTTPSVRFHFKLLLRMFRIFFLDLLSCDRANRLATSVSIHVCRGEY